MKKFTISAILVMSVVMLSSAAFAGTTSANSRGLLIGQSSEWASDTVVPTDTVVPQQKDTTEKTETFCLADTVVPTDTIQPEKKSEEKSEEQSKISLADTVVPADTLIPEKKK